MSKSSDRHAASPATGSPGTNGNGKAPREEIDEAEYFLVPLLATDPLPYLFDVDGNPVNAEGEPLAGGNGVPESIRKLQEKLRSK